MNAILEHALLFFDLTAANAEPLNGDGDVYKISDSGGCDYFLKMYGVHNNYDIIPGENVYHTFGQIQLESEILHRLSDSALKTAHPLRTKSGGFVATLDGEFGDEFKFATLTSYIEGLAARTNLTPTPETAYAAGVSAALLHLESEKSLLQIAKKRPHKKQDYVKKIQSVLERGTGAGVISAAQFEMLGRCCNAVIKCMDELDVDQNRNVGLVHTDIIGGNIVIVQNHATLVDFSRSVCSYYLYDLAEMCLHGNFGGAGRDLQNAIIRGYHTVKPVVKADMLAMQTLFVLFILTVMAESIDTVNNPWRDNVMEWLGGEVLPRLDSGIGYMDPSVYENVIKS